MDASILTIMTWLPFVPSVLADSLEGQFQWWLCGVLYGMQLCVLGELVRFIRSARRGVDSP